MARMASLVGRGSILPGLAARMERRLPTAGMIWAEGDVEGVGVKRGDGHGRLVVAKRDMRVRLSEGLCYI